MGINEDIPVNDGRGLWDNAGLCDTLVSDCNNLVKQLCSGQHVLFCNTVVQMVQKLANLKKGIQEEIKSKNKIIEELKRTNNMLMEEKTGLPVDKDGADHGEN